MVKVFYSFFKIPYIRLIYFSSCNIFDVSHLQILPGTWFWILQLSVRKQPTDLTSKIANQLQPAETNIRNYLQPTIYYSQPVRYYPKLKWNQKRTVITQNLSVSPSCHLKLPKHTISKLNNKQKYKMLKK